jgi:fructokinase
VSEVANPEIVAIGEALIDIIEVEGRAPEERVGGSPANVALGLGRLGARVGLLTQLGRDRRGAAIADHLRASGVELLAGSITDGLTSTALAAIGADGQAEYTFDVRWERLPEEPITARVVHTGSIAAFLEPGASSLRELLSRSHADEITFDPNIRPALLGPRNAAVARFEELAALSTVVKMSDEDSAWLYPGSGVAEVIDRVLSLGPRLAAITLGAEGAELATGEARVRVDGVTVRAVDTIGAGDTFMASLVDFVAKHGSRDLDARALEHAGSAAVQAAAITVSRAGADLPWAHEVSAPPA